MNTVIGLFILMAIVSAFIIFVFEHELDIKEKVIMFIGVLLFIALLIIGGLFLTNFEDIKG